MVVVVDVVVPPASSTFYSIVYVLLWIVVVCVVVFAMHPQPSNIQMIRQLKNAPPSNRVKNKSDKVKQGEVVLG